METDIKAFSYIISLAAVINGLGIVRLLGGLAEFLRSRNRQAITHYWVFNLWALLHFLLHILLWWSMWGARHVADLNFLTFLYLLTGPIVLFLGSSLLIPDQEEEALDLRRQYASIRRAYFSTLSLFWLWASGLWPVLAGIFAPTTPFFLANLLVSITLAWRSDARLHGALTIGTYVLVAIFVGLFSMHLGGVSKEILAR